MPRDSSGIYTKPSGTTAVFDTTIDPDAYNNLADDVASELTGSLPTNGSKGMGVGAQLKLDAGSNSVPGLTFTGDLDSGIYSPAANKVAVAVGGVKVTEFDSTGIVEGAWTDTASASTVDLGAVLSRNLNITGTTTITAFGTVATGTYRRLKFAGALTLTHNGTSLILPGAANITTAAGDTAEFVSLGAGNWICVDYQRASGLPIVLSVSTGLSGTGTVANPLKAGPTAATAQNTTSGTNIDFSSIPSGIKRITLMLAGVSTSGTNQLLVQIGTGGAATTTGYVATSNVLNQSNNTAGASSTAGFIVNQGSAAASVTSGHVVITNLTGNQWVASHTVKNSTTQVSLGGGDVSLSGTLDFLRLTTVGGTDTFDAGAVNIFYS